MEKLKPYSDHVPDNFGHRYTLLEAELARVNGDSITEVVDKYSRASR